MSKFLSREEFSSHFELIEAIRTSKEPERCFAEARAEAFRRAFAERYKVRESSRQHICGLLNKRCNYASNCLHEKWYDIGVDHPVLWQRKGKALCFTFEPYGLSTKNIAALAQMSSELKLECQISAESWHFPTATVLVELWNEYGRTLIERENKARVDEEIAKKVEAGLLPAFCFVSKDKLH